MRATRFGPGIPSSEYGVRKRFPVRASASGVMSGSSRWETAACPIDPHRPSAPRWMRHLAPAEEQDKALCFSLPRASRARVCRPVQFFVTQAQSGEPSLDGVAFNVT